MGLPGRKVKPTSVIVTLKGKSRQLRGVRVVGDVKIKKLESVNGRHVQVEITGVEIDGFGSTDSLDNRPPV